MLILNSKCFFFYVNHFQRVTTFAIKDIKLVKREVYNFKKVNGKWKERITTSRLKSFEKGNKKTIEKGENKKKC